MKTKLAFPLLTAIVGVAIYIGASQWAGQTGYYNPDPALRDANIGAGILALLGIVIGICGLIWLIVELIKSTRRNRG